MKNLELQYREVCMDDAMPCDEMTNVNFDYSIRMRAIRLRLQRHVLAQEAESRAVEWPADWWQAFRQRWLPSWWLKRHPVRVESRRLVAMATYPNLVHPPGHDPVVKFHVENTSPIYEEPEFDL